MSKKKKTRPGAGTPRRAAETGSASQAATIPNPQFTPNCPAGQRKISELLSYGQESAVPLRHLEKMANMPGRVVRRMIEAEPRAGTVIASDNQHGYWLTDDPAEAERFSRSMEHRAREILRTARAIREAAGID